MSSNFYGEEITDSSYKELTKFMNKMNEKNIQSILIGGWAVYTFESSMGSRDIDMIMPNQDSIDYLYCEYFPENNFNPVKIGAQIDHHKKIISTDYGSQDIIFQVWNSETTLEHKNLDILMDWNWIEQFQESKPLEEIEVNVAKRELLIITKILAALLRLKKQDIKLDYRLGPKIWKDYRDVAILAFGNQIDASLLDEYLQKSKINQHLDKFLATYKQNQYSGILEKLNKTFEEVESIFKL